MNGLSCEYQPVFLVWPLATFAFLFPSGNIRTRFSNTHSSRKTCPLIFYTTQKELFRGLRGLISGCKNIFRVRWRKDMVQIYHLRKKSGVMRFVFSLLSFFLPYCASHSPTAWHWLLLPSSFFFPVYSKHKRARLKWTTSINNNKGIKANYWVGRWNGFGFHASQIVLLY